MHEEGGFEVYLWGWKCTRPDLYYNWGVKSREVCKYLYSTVALVAGLVATHLYASMRGTIERREDPVGL
jgi:hypothetical protein